MKASNLSRSELIGVLAGVLLVGSLFMEWFSLDTGPGVVRDEPDDWVCGVGHASCSGFDTFPILRWLLIAAAAAPAILAWIVIREHQLTWPRGELTAIVGLIALLLIVMNGLIDRPSPNDIGVGLSYGYFVALLAAIGIVAAGSARAIESGGGAQRKPPATF